MSGSEMTGRERLHAALKGEDLDRIPFAINLWQWFYANQSWDKLPAAYGGMRPLEFLKAIGADILTRWEAQIKGRAGLGQYVKFPNCHYTATYSGEKPKYPLTTAFNDYTEGLKIQRKLETPHGVLTQRWRFTGESCADFEEEYWIKDFLDQYEAIKFMVQDRTYDYEMAEYERDMAAIGEHGLVIVEIPENPVKMLHWLAGPEQATYFIMDHEDKFRELAEIHTRKTIEFINGVVERTKYDDCPLLMSNDNLDAMLMPEFFFDKFLYDHYQRVADAIHDAGRLFCVHSCGNNWDIRHCIRDSGIDMMEGLTPSPLGNFPLHLAQKEIGPHFIVNGGMHVEHQEKKTGAKEAIDAYTRKLFDEMGYKKRFIYGSSCNTSPFTPLDNILYFRDACWKYGKMS